LQPSGVVELTSATLPPVALMLIGVVSTVFGVGRGAPVVPPASSTNWCCPGWSTPFRGVIRFVAEPKFPVPLALVYWSDQVPRSTGALPRLKSSMKSFVYGAPALPPPP